MAIDDPAGLIAKAEQYLADSTLPHFEPDFRRKVLRVWRQHLLDHPGGCVISDADALPIAKQIVLDVICDAIVSDGAEPWFDDAAARLANYQDGVGEKPIIAWPLSIGPGEQHSSEPRSLTERERRDVAHWIVNCEAHQHLERREHFAPRVARDLECIRRRLCDAKDVRMVLDAATIAGRERRNRGFNLALLIGFTWWIPFSLYANWDAVARWLMSVLT